jgi:uncharacterized protein DUF6801
MTWSGRTARRVPKAVARTLALAGLLAASGIAAGTASAAGGGRVPGRTATVTALAYQCRFPSGPRPVEVTVAAGLPSAGRTGRPIQPTGVRLTMALPQAAVADLAGLHSTAVSAATMFGIDTANSPSGTSVVWAGATRRAADVPARGGLVLKTSGRVPSLTPTLPGDVTLAAAGLSLTLTPGTANATPSPSPTPVPGSAPNQGATPAPSTADGVALRVNCTLVPGQHATLATVAVAGAPVRVSQASRASRASRVSSGKNLCPPLPAKGLKLNPKFPPPKAPKGAKVNFPTPANACAYIVGYSNVRKLNGASLIGPGLTALSLNVRTVIKNGNPGYFEFDNAGVLDFKPCPTCKTVHGLPPAHATFLGFGFVPVSATLQLTEVGTTNVFAIGTAFALTTNLIFSEVALRVFDVKVNGVPLDVGPHCQSAHPIVLRLVGNPNSKPPYSVQGGGPLTGEITLPPFRGCGVGENLDPLFTASISGPGNFVLLTQGELCSVIGNFGCEQTPDGNFRAVIPKPIRKVTE